MKRQLNGLDINDTLLKEAPFVQRIDDGHPQNQGIVSIQPIEHENSTIGYIIMHTPVAPIEETIETLKKQLSIISCHFFSLSNHTRICICCFIDKTYSSPRRSN